MRGMSARYPDRGGKQCAAGAAVHGGSSWWRERNPARGKTADDVQILLDKRAEDYYILGYGRARPQYVGQRAELNLPHRRRIKRW